MPNAPDREPRWRAARRLLHRGHGHSWTGDGAWARGVLIALGVGALYLAAARLGLLLVKQPENVAVLWPAAGVSAGALVAFGPVARWPVAASVVLATAAANLAGRGTVEAGVAFGLCNAAECLLFAALVERLDRPAAWLEDLRSVLVFLLAAAVAAAVASVPAALSLHLLGMSAAPLLDLWLGWFQSDAIGIVVLAPIFMALPAIVRTPPSLPTVVESGVALVSTAAASGYAFALTVSAAAWPIITPATLLFPVFLWLAGRLPLVVTALGALLTAVAIVVTAITGVGRLGDASVPLADRVAAAQIAILTASLCGLTLAAMFARLRNAAAALRSSDDRSRLALDAARMYAFEFDPASQVVHRTGSLIERLGLPAKGRIDDYIRTIHPADREAFRGLLPGLSAAEPRVMRVMRLLAVDGSYVVIAHRAEATFDARGNLLRVLGTCVDISAPHAAQEALRASERRLREALSAGRVFAFDFEAATGKVRRSLNAAEILGVSAEEAQMDRDEFIGRVHPDDRALLARSERPRAQAAPYSDMMVRFVRPDGAIAWLQITETATFDGAGALVRIQGLTRDVTERKLAEERQEWLITELDHRVKNALASMSIVIDRSRDGHDTLEGYVAALEGRIASMKRTHERLAASRWGGVSLAAIVDDELMPYRAPGNMTVEGPDLELPPRAAQALSMTLHELATNAAKHGALSSAGGQLAVSWLVEEPAGDGKVVRLRWRERSVGVVGPPASEGVGMGTIRNMLRHEQGATVDVSFLPEGLACDIELPVRWPAPRLDLAAVAAAPGLNPT